MTTQPANRSRPRLPAGLVAAGGALLSALFSKVLFGFAYAGPAADFLTLVFPFVTGAAGVFAARSAIRALRNTKAAGYGAVVRGLLEILAFLALLVDIAVIGFAAFIGLMILHGPIVQ